MVTILADMNYDIGEYIYAKIQAVNDKGPSILSNVGTPLQAASTPTISPKNFKAVINSVSPTVSITLYWDLL